ncbi:hypothetical protein [Bacteroides sp. 519]|uniref:hypothetical protein n=1 Tax=Bacteroides sp. 519 TaxID=2302937 RepID=UPI0013D24B64|nr:hypothetical protein [Bacteroides sp. 519]NDV60162.1 hypothetical protein [Bacteroides sp. 519]
MRKLQNIYLKGLIKGYKNDLRNDDMKFYWIFFYIMMFTGTLKAQENKWECIKKKLDPFCYRILWDNYFYYYFDFPKSIESFIDFQKDMYQAYPNDFVEKCKNENLMFLINYKEEIEFREEDGEINLWLDELQLLKTNKLFHPCEVFDISESVKEYYDWIKKYGPPRFFNKKSEAVIHTEKLDSIFCSENNYLKNKFLIDDEFTLPKSIIKNEMSNEDEECVLFTFFIYKRDDNFYYLCDNKKFESELLYWNILKKYLDVFCKNNEIEKIIFASPEFSHK